MAEKALSCARAVLDGGPRTAASRELAQRRSGTVEVRLLWHPVGDWVELCLRDLALGTGFRVVVAPDSALDAFYHPYAYEPGSDAAYADRDEPALDDGQLAVIQERTGLLVAERKALEARGACLDGDAA